MIQYKPYSDGNNIYFELTEGMYENTIVKIEEFEIKEIDNNGKTEMACEFSHSVKRGEQLTEDDIKSEEFINMIGEIMSNFVSTAIKHSIEMEQNDRKNDPVIIT